VKVTGCGGGGFRSTTTRSGKREDRSRKEEGGSIWTEVLSAERARRRRTKEINAREVDGLGSRWTTKPI
jgi:hypothetical protein